MILKAEELQNYSSLDFKKKINLQISDLSIWSQFVTESSANYGSTDKSIELLKSILLDIQKSQATEIMLCLQHKLQLLSVDIIFTYLDSELYLPSQNNGIEKKLIEKNCVLKKKQIASG